MVPWEQKVAYFFSVTRLCPSFPQVVLKHSAAAGCQYSCNILTSVEGSGQIGKCQPQGFRKCAYTVITWGFAKMQILIQYSSLKSAFLAAPRECWPVNLPLRGKNLFYLGSQNLTSRSPQTSLCSKNHYHAQYQK